MPIASTGVFRSRGLLNVLSIRAADAAFAGCSGEPPAATSSSAGACSCRVTAAAPGDAAAAGPAAARHDAAAAGHDAARHAAATHDGHAAAGVAADAAAGSGHGPADSRRHAPATRAHRHARQDDKLSACSGVLIAGMLCLASTCTGRALCQGSQSGSLVGKHILDGGSRLQSHTRAAPMPPPPRSDGDEPDAKRQRTDFVLQPEDEFLERHPGGARVRVQVGFRVFCFNYERIVHAYRLVCATDR